MLFGSALLTGLLVAGTFFDAMAEEHVERDACRRPVALAQAALAQPERREE